MNNWRDVLPINRIELWILRVALVFAIFISGAGSMAIYMLVYKDDFKRGADYMQKAYTTPGHVFRITQTEYNKYERR